MPCYFCLPWLCWVDVWTWVGFVHPLNPRFLPVQFCCADWLSHFPFSLLVMGFWHSSFSFCVAVLVQEPAGHVCGSACVSLTPTLTWDSAAAIFLFPYVCVLSILGLKVSFQVMAESQPFSFQPCLSHYPFPSLMTWVTALKWRGAAEPGTSVEPCSEFAALVEGCRFADQSLHWRWKMLV